MKLISHKPKDMVWDETDRKWTKTNAHIICEGRLAECREMLGNIFRNYGLTPDDVKFELQWQEGLSDINYDFGDEIYQIVE